LLHAPQLNIEISLDLLQRDFLARLANRKVDFAKSTNPQAAFDGEVIKRLSATTV
jgi:hypothetical protein